jgi:hypothetical protein
MKIRHWDFDHQNYAVVDYPDDLFRPFLDWLFTTKTWWADQSLIRERTIKLEQAMGEYRVAHPEAIRRPWDPVDAAKLRRTEKARATKAANALLRKQQRAEEAVTAVVGA